MAIRLNCDMGESFGIWKMGNDEEIMPLIDMANLACGFHASDAITMSRSVNLAKKYNVTIGAHPSYNDLLGFGRRTMLCSLEEIKSIILYQLGALNAFCIANGTTVSYVKPHGALYNDMMRDENIFKAILNAVSSFDKNIKVMVLSGLRNQDAVILNRNIICSDINPKALNRTKECLKFDSGNKAWSKIFLWDARKLDKLPDSSIDFVLTHPPYVDIIKYSEGELDNDLSNIHEVDQFADEMEKVAQEKYRVLRPGKYCAILMGDTRRNKMYQPLAYRVMEKFLKVGFKLKEDIIKQ
jgi:hypothetical protein